MKDLLHRLFYVAAELPRSFIERVDEELNWAQVRAMTPDGDYHPVIAYPGVSHNNFFTAHLGDRFGEKKYDVHKWEGLLNHGISERTYLRDEEQLVKIYKKHGPVSLVAHSHGGIPAAVLYHNHPEKVRNFIAMGTPRTKHSLINRGLTDDKFARYILTVPEGRHVTSLHSDTDPIVPGESSLMLAGAGVENIKVNSSHLGMETGNTQAIIIILDRLAQTVENWRPFDPEKYGGIFSSKAHAPAGRKFGINIP